MWRTSDGVTHTVALPNPAQPFTDEAAEAIRKFATAMGQDGWDALLEELADAAIAASDEHPFAAEQETEYEAAPPPIGAFTALVSDAEDLRAAVARLPWRWRLDAVLAMEDLADD